MPLPQPTEFRAQARLLDFLRQSDEPGLINLAAGVPSLDALPTAELREATVTVMEHDGPSAFAYHHPEGDHALRECLAERLCRRGAELTGSQILTTTGCTQALHVMLAVTVQL